MFLWANENAVLKLITSSRSKSYSNVLFLIMFSRWEGANRLLVEGKGQSG